MRSDDLADMQHAALQGDGAAALLHWLARRLAARVVLLDLTEASAAGSPPEVARVLKSAGGDVRRVLTGEAAAASISGPSWWARAAAVDGPGSDVLLVTASGGGPGEDGALIGHAAALLRLCLASGRKAAAASQIREAVLHLLMTGHVDTARRVAGAMKPDLAATLRVYIAEGTPGQRNELAAACDAAGRGQAWIVRCPVYRRHLIILSPDIPGSGPDEKILEALRLAAGNACVGIGDVVALRDTAAGYEQAYHALAVARHRPDRCAQFTAAGDLADLLGPGAGEWARGALAPLLDYQPARPQHPDSAELRRTLTAWLTFRAGAWRVLHIDRNTLTKRMHLTGKILGRDLSRLGEQAEIGLALQLLHRPGGGPAPGTGELLRAPCAREWATLVLAPLAREEDHAVLAAVRAWIAADARSAAAAAALGVTPKWVLELLGRAEERLGRSLTGAPSARHDLHLALRILGQQPEGS